MKIFIKLLRESFRFALHEISVNKTRTVLSLLGITIGIFSIISVFTIFDSMERAIRDNINSLGNNVLFVQKWPWAMGGDYPWWKYIKRPEPKLTDLKEIQKRSKGAEASAFMVEVYKSVKYQGRGIQNTQIVGVSEDFDRVMPVDIGSGRFISPAEFLSGRNVAVIGQTIATELFKGVDPIGKRIHLFGNKLEIIGLFKKEGDDMFGNSSDGQVMIPIKYMRNYVDLKSVGTSIVIRGKPHVSMDELKDELTGILRSIHRVKPKSDDDFAINELDIITKGFDSLFSVIAWVGWIIGGFSLLVGGFGIANIMFVSVKERTRIIGVQKAMGAKKYFILLQFLFESIFLSLIGGVVGLIIVFLLSFLISSALDMRILLSQSNIILGISVSALIGLVSGFIPAWSASRLDPVEAMRSTF